MSFSPDRAHSESVMKNRSLHPLGLNIVLQLFMRDPDVRSAPVECFGDIFHLPGMPENTGSPFCVFEKNVLAEAAAPSFEENQLNIP